jgi:hypothetical protein
MGAGARDATMTPPIKRVSVPRAPILKYALWDGTDPVDSQVLGRGLARARWMNQVRASDQLAIAAKGQPAILQPMGGDGMVGTDALLFRGMFEFPSSVLGRALHSDSEGHTADFVAVSGHGVPGFMFSESLIPLAMSRPIQTTVSEWSLSVGQWSYVSAPRWSSPAPTIALFSACRQLQGQPQQFYWSETMRCSNPVRAILSYRETAPAAGTSAAINQRLVRNLRSGQRFVEAWRQAHVGPGLRARWAALCYEASVGDTLTAWMRSARPPSTPDIGSRILYFDEANPNGRPVEQPRQEVDCWLTVRGRADRLPPWYLCRNGAQLDLHVRVLTPGGRIDPGDKLYVVASQVRPDYFGPFSIENLFVFEGTSGWPTGALSASQRIHDASPDFGNDTYEVLIDSSGPTAPSPDSQSITLPIQLGRAQNPHIPLYYFHVACRGPAGKAIGMKVTHLEDDFQFGMFRLPWL